jgi:two-component system, NtrC family, sensor kinase
LTRLKYSLILILLALLHIGNLAQGQIFSSIHLTDIPDTGITLNRGWKFFEGDHLDFAKPDFDDRSWLDFDPSSDHLKTVSAAKPGIYWIRLRFSVDSTLLPQQFSALIEQFTASELYVNGKLVQRFGTVHSDPKKVVAYDPLNFPVSIPIGTRETQVWAVRYAFQPGLLYMKEGNASYPLFRARLISTDDAFQYSRKHERQIPITNTFRVGAFFILAILHLVFFFFNRSQNAYLFFFIYAIFMMAGDITQFNIPFGVKRGLLTAMMINTFWRISSFFLLAALYSLLNQKKGWIFWSLVVLGFLATFHSNWNVSIFLVDTLITIELVRTGLKASWLNVKGSWIITAGAISYLIFAILFNAGVFFRAAYWFWPLGETYMVADLIYALATLSIPVATTIYIALNFAFTSRALELKLSEVDALSRKNIEQEKEKQQILEQANMNLEKQVAERTGELQRSLSELKSTQSQLIQAEKMASLGELTAGIAHEIQNPLNFVNNFAEVNTEMITEVKEAISAGNLEDAEGVLDMVADNEQKILQHGKRADAIVKGMLQHSRTTTGIKEPTDINALTDEYLRLAFHGMRAKDKSFNADYIFTPDSNIGKIQVVPQDIGRVILNLINNAFYAVKEKSAAGDPNYKPCVEVSTSRNEDKLTLTVKDNGHGIPSNIKDKIFQPFFTTKPTGEGTGLGLSLSYDIVKAHGGELNVESEEGKGTIFSIIL